jgi:hypothetical protein
MYAFRDGRLLAAGSLVSCPVGSERAGEEVEQRGDIERAEPVGTGWPA